ATMTGTTPTFGSTVSGAGFDLALDFSGSTTINGANFTGIANLSSADGGTTQLTGTISTSGTQTYGDAVTLTGPTTLTSSGNQAISFDSTVDGAQNLAVNTTGAASFDAAVGAITPLASLTTNAGGSTSLGGAVTTIGAQTYNDAVSLISATALTTAGGDITGSGTFDGTTGTLTLAAGAGNVSLTNAGNDFSAVTVTSANNVSVMDANALFVGPVFATGDVVFQTAAGAGNNLILTGNISSTATGDSIVLDTGGNFFNPAAQTLSAPSGRWLVYSNDPASDVQGGLAYAFKQYNATYGVTSVAGSGNGFLYTLAPIITPSLSGSASRTYDGMTAAPTASLSASVTGAVGSDTVTLGFSAADYVDKNVGTSKQVTATGITIASASDAGKSVYGYQLATASASANIGTISPAALTLSAVSDSKTYDGTTSSSGTPSVTGTVFSGDNLSGLSQAFASRNVLGANGSTLNANPAYTLTDGNGGANYTVSLASAAGTISPAALAVTADSGARLYGDPNPPLGAAITGLVGGDTPAVIPAVTVSTSATPASNVGNYATDVSSGANANYAIAYVSGLLEITPAPLTITADNAARPAQAANPPFTATSTGFKLGQTTADLSGNLLLSTPATTTSTPGAYPIVPGGVASTNYAITFVDGALLVGAGASPEDSALVAGIERIILLVSGVTHPGDVTNMQLCRLLGPSPTSAEIPVEVQQSLIRAAESRPIGTPSCGDTP
ncbi:MAG: beta strand repeat-containing protein, partial [Burkholderiales bacterium]